jgi:hypothetical protein
MRQNKSMIHTHRRPALLLFLLAILTILLASSNHAALAQDENELSDLWIDLSMGAPLLDLFNQHARADDIARVEHISQLDLLDSVQVGKKLVVFKSAADAIRLLPHIHDSIDIVGYNLEHGPANPLAEQENPLESIQRLREVTESYDLELALGPDRRFAESDGAVMAPYADYFILQVQKVQTDPETVYEFVEPLIADIRRANPEIQISLQIRTEGDVEELIALFEPLQDSIQGISILTSEETLPVSEEIMQTLRPVRRPVTPTAEAEEPATRVPGAILTAEPRPTRRTIEENVQQTPVAVAQVRTADETSEPAATEVLSPAQATERSGSTALFIVIALVTGFALGAGYVSHRTGT